MKILFFLSMVVMLASEKTCKKKNAAVYDNCFKGKLEIKANCMNYTVSIVEGNMDTAFFQASWTDDNTGKSYRNVFALGSKCNFPNTINEGEEFYFMIDSSAVQDCAVCMMYYPVPSKKLQIRVIPGPCATGEQTNR